MQHTIEAIWGLDHFNTASVHSRRNFGRFFAVISRSAKRYKIGTRAIDLLCIRNSRVTERHRGRGRRSGWSGSRGIDQSRCIRRRGGRWRRIRRGGLRGPIAVGRHRQEHVVAESGLVSAGAPDVHPTALTTGNRGPVGQGHRRVTTAPPDHQGVGSGPILETSRQQSGFLIPRIKPVAKNRPVGCGIGYPRRESGTVGPGRRISTNNIRRPRDLIHD
jgi:hypothetical protein